ncbi:MAG: SOS response-associated peptidase [Pirellulaceae bacterium]
MCGRFTIHSKLNLLLQQFALEMDERELPDFEPRYNLAPTNQAPVILQTESGRKLELMRWGLIPSWAKDKSIGNRTINARAESLSDKPSFRSAFKRRRCLVPADGYYEWMKVGKEKQAFLIRTIDERPFAMAGLWETWHDPDTAKNVPSFTIVTTAANDATSQIHDRTPVILTPSEFDLWLDPEVQETPRLQTLLDALPADRIKVDPVGNYVNKVGHEGEQCVQIQRTLF